MNKLQIRNYLLSLLAALALAGCATADKNQPPPPAEPPMEAKPVGPAPVMEPEPETIVLKGVNFDTDKDTLKPEAVSILDHAVNVINQHPDRKFGIQGHTDDRASHAHNDDLSLRRAQRVNDYLVSHGVNADQLYVSSYGERVPVASNSSEAGMAENRRVEIIPLP